MRIIISSKMTIFQWCLSIFVPCIPLWFIPWFILTLYFYRSFISIFRMPYPIVFCHSLFSSLLFYIVFSTSTFSIYSTLLLHFLSTLLLHFLSTPLYFYIFYPLYFYIFYLLHFYIFYLLYFYIFHQFWLPPEHFVNPIEGI